MTESDSIKRWLIDDYLKICLTLNDAQKLRLAKPLKPIRFPREKQWHLGSMSRLGKAEIVRRHEIGIWVGRNLTLRIPYRSMSLG